MRRGTNKSSAVIAVSILDSVNGVELEGIVIVFAGPNLYVFGIDAVRKSVDTSWQKSVNVVANDSVIAFQDRRDVSVKSINVGRVLEVLKDDVRAVRVKRNGL